MQNWIRSARNDIVVTSALFCACYLIFVLLWPSYYDTMSPDSGGYLEFSPLRTTFYPVFLAALKAAGLSIPKIVTVQLTISAFALFFCVVALRRSGGPLWLAGLFVLLQAHPYFSSYHHVIQAESLYFSGTYLLIAALLEFFKRQRIVDLAWASLSIGILIGIRPAAVVLLPMLPLAYWIARRPVTARALVVFVAMVIPASAAILVDRVVHMSVHRLAVTDTEIYSYMSYTMLAQSAMLVRSDMKYDGPSAAQFASIGSRLSKVYEPVHAYLDNMPALPARAVIEASYENAALFHVMAGDIKNAAAAAGITESTFRKEFAKQVFVQNPDGLIKLVMTHYLGYWSLVAPNFPPFAKSINAYSKSFGTIPLTEFVKEDIYFPKASLFSIPNFLPAIFAGIGTLFLAIYFVIMLIRGGATSTNLLVVAGFFSVMCQIYIGGISVMTAAQPRYFFAIYPQLTLIGILCLQRLAAIAAQKRA